MSAGRRPASLERNPRLSQWVRPKDDGSIEVRSGKVELGQGILTALRQAAAEELDVAPQRVRMVAASTADSPDEGMTSGSLSVQDSGSALRRACAEVRALFVEAAAARLGVPAASVRVADGTFHAPDGRSTTYAALCGEVSLDREATGGIAPKAPDGHAQDEGLARRLDLPDKVLGRARFVHDLALPGLLHGRVLRPPSPGARLVSLDDDPARRIRGVLAVVRDGSFVGVVAEGEPLASRAAERLRASSRWEERDTLPDETRLGEWMDAAPCETTAVAERPAPAGATVARTLRARFTRPFLAHAAIGPSCAVARWDDGRLHVWCHAQGPYPLRADLALVFGVAPEAVVVEHREGAGCYGHNGADDVALDAALLARAVPGRPVRVQWSREDELAWSPFGPAMAVDIEADLDADGELLAWRTDVRGNGHGIRPGRGKSPTLLAAAHLANAFPPALAVNAPLAAGGGAERNAIPEYAVPALRVANHRLLAMPVRASALRSLGAFLNVYAIESMADEIAALRGEDPLAWRLRHLAEPRSRAVLERVAARAGWAGRERREGVGWGLGYARYKGTGAWCAVVARVELAREVRARHLWVAVDVGRAIDADGVANQVEGGAIQAASWALREAVRFDQRRVTSATWETYPVLRFSEVPAVEVDVLPRPEEPSLGAGEASLGPTAAALGNAVRDALGVAARDLPLDRERLARLILG